MLTVDELENQSRIKNEQVLKMSSDYNPFTWEPYYTRPLIYTLVFVLLWFVIAYFIEFMSEGNIIGGIKLGREIRRVPKGWQHPKNDNGNYQPMHDRDYDTEAKEWIDNLMKWENGTHPDKERVLKEYGDRYFWDWDGAPPNKDYHRPKYDSEPTHYQIYETVSEGTPVSPVFETKDEMVKWLTNEGYSEESAKKFANTGWAPSMIFTPSKGLKSNIHALEDI